MLVGVRATGVFSLTRGFAVFRRSARCGPRARFTTSRFIPTAAPRPARLLPADRRQVQAIQQVHFFGQRGTDATLRAIPTRIGAIAPYRCDKDALHQSWSGFGNPIVNYK